MAESSPTLDRRTTKTRSVIFAALRSAGHAKVADALGISESTFSEWLQKHGDRIAQLLTATDLKPVPIAVECHPPEYIEHLQYFAKIGIKNDSAPSLDWDPS